MTNKETNYNTQYFENALSNYFNNGNDNQNQPGNYFDYDHIQLPVTYLRVIHNVAGGPNVNVDVDGNNVINNLTYKKDTGYLLLSKKIHNIDIIDTQTNKKIASYQLDLSNGGYNTLIVNGSATDPKYPISPLLLKDINKCNQDKKSRVRFIHGIPGVPPVNVTANNNTIFNNVAYGKVAEPFYLEVDPGNISVGAKLSGNNNVALNPQNINLQQGSTYTIIATGSSTDKKYPAGLIILTDDQCFYINL